MPTRAPKPHENLDDFGWDGDTWYPIDRDCPDCDGDLYSNGAIQQCSGTYENTERDCDWWGVITD